MTAVRVTFWGVRGTFPAAGAAYARYGGDTMCIEIGCGAITLILDAGSGLRALGAKLNARSRPGRMHVLLSHLHLDHIMGLPHFAPFWRPGADIRVHAAEESIAQECGGPMSIFRPPLFPLDSRHAPANVSLNRFRIGESVAVEKDIIVRSAPVTHQGACCAFIVSAGARTIAYVTDHEHGDAATDRAVAEAVKGADLLIYDATFTDAEMPAHRGWGHSSWEEGLRLKRRSRAKLLALAHHHPDRTDDELDARAEHAADACSDVFFARQGLSLDL
ncbi:MAG: MBL fold metallo-hydrolase [Alphaproteobacteria bacterium]|nr:MBL fold metallo-hydrolase [Alphaproteobacteria bacterium]